MRNKNLQPSRSAAKYQDLRLFFAALLLLTACCLPITAQTDYTHWVNPFIGTGGHGHTFPGATMPFGMVQLSPDTRTDNWDGSSGYHYSDDVIYGFSHTHLSGTGIPDYCDILFMPLVGEPKFLTKVSGEAGSRYTSKFSHAEERAEPGYYSVKLNDGIFAEMTSTPRVGLHRYTFPVGSDPKILLDLTWRDKTLMSEVHVQGNRVEGWRRSSSWAKDQVIYFSAEFSQPFGAPYWGKDNSGYDGSQTWVDNSIGQHIRAAFPFDLRKNRQILLKVALSPVSIEGARKNLAAEMPGWDFDKVRADAKAAWNKELSKIEVSGGTDAQTTTFYTALYHTMIQPNIFEDVDGSYRGHDGKIHNIADEAMPGRGDEEKGRRGANPKSEIQTPKSPSDEYTVFSLWDTFRAAHPLYTIIEQRRTVDFINTFIRQYEQGGRLPVWELAGNETDCMIGYHAVSVIADAMAKGIKGFDYEKAYEASKHSAELDREGLAAYKRRGYISSEDSNESVSKTLEYAYDDWCIAQMAGTLATKLEAEILRTGVENGFNEKAIQVYLDEKATFENRARSFENLFDPTTGFMRPRQNGGFVRPFAPNEVTFNYTEGNAWVYTFFVPQDLSRLMELLGGKEAFTRKLDELFTTHDKLAGREQPDITGLIGQYAHGNEPSHHIAYLYDYAGHPEKTQKYIRQILDNFYKPTPDGLIGNEDCGQMSAWYVMSASGFYEVTPGSGTYALGTPLFPEIKYHLENGKTFVIRAPAVSSTNIYVRSTRLDGAPYNKAFINHTDIMKGGTLEFAMGPEPSLESPVSAMTFASVPVPIIEGPRVFSKVTTIFIHAVDRKLQIRYTLDGSEPTPSSALFESPFVLERDSVVKAIAIDPAGNRSLVAMATYAQTPHDWSVKIDSKYNRQYTGGGDEGLIDGIRGTTSFASGEWQGYQGQDFVATIDLKKDTTVSEVGGGFLQNAGSWIWMPTHIEFEVSTDGTNFTRVAEIKTDVAVTDMDSKIRDYGAKISPMTARYVRVHAFNLGKIPSWHPGAGSDAFIFVDEIWAK